MGLLYLYPLIFNTNMLHNVLIIYCSDMFWTHFLAIFRELVSFFGVCNLYANLFGRSFTHMITF